MGKNQNEYIYSRERELSLLQSGNDEISTRALLAITFNDNDWKWVQDLCLDLINHPNNTISFLAVTCLGHLARIHKQIEKDKVVNVLQSKTKDKELTGRIEDAINDIEMFAK